MENTMSEHCQHHWTRDDKHTAQCIHCKTHAPASEVL